MLVKSVASVLLLVVLAAGISCGKTGSPVIAVVPKSQTPTFWQAVHAGAIAAAQEAGVRVLWNGPDSELDSARQIRIVDEFINQRVDGIVLAPAHGESLVPIVERAAQEKIPVAIIDSGIQTEKYLSYISTDNHHAGILAAEQLGGLLTAGEVAILGSTPGSVSSAERERGFRETLAAKFPALQVVDFQYGMADRAKSAAVAESMLAARPDLAALFSGNESGTSGAVQAAKAGGVAGKLKIVGFDASPSLIEDLRAGSIHALVLQNPFRMGYLSVRAVADKLHGQTSERRIHMRATVVTAANLNEAAIRELVNPPLARYLK